MNHFQDNAKAQQELKAAAFMPMNGAGLGQAYEQPKYKASVEVAEMLGQLAERGEKLAESLAERLYEYGGASPEELVNSCDAVRGFPPYFTSLRYNIMRISATLDIIEKTVQNSEL